MADTTNIEQLIGRTFARVGVDGTKVVFMDPADGGATVTIGATGKRVLDTVGRLPALAGTPILEARRADVAALPAGATDAPFCWTFVTVGTLAGSVHLRFMGASGDAGDLVAVTES